MHPRAAPLPGLSLQASVDAHRPFGRAPPAARVPLPGRRRGVATRVLAALRRLLGGFGGAGDREGQ